MAAAARRHVHHDNKTGQKQNAAPDRKGLSAPAHLPASEASLKTPRGTSSSFRFEHEATAPQGYWKERAREAKKRVREVSLPLVFFT
eukprot:scaffold260197_cov31-Tisochrysis_lutea.AAC.1